MKKKINIAFIGLSHLGLSYLAAASSKGFEVLGIDPKQRTIDELNRHIIDYNEPNLKKTILKNRKNITFTSNFNTLKKCKIVFISQDTPTDKKGKSKNNILRKLIKKTSPLLNKKSILVILSQVQPGFTRLIKFDHTRLYYQVETLIFGSSLERASNPERLIVGCNDPKTKIKKFFLNYLQSFKCPIIKMNFESAELTKISINIMLASSITTTNMLAEVCKKISADWYEIMPALKLDQRIGEKAYIKPGLGISGGNIERDIYSITNILKGNDKTLSVVKTFQKVSNHMKLWVYRILQKEKIFKRGKKFNIGIFGLAYKENTNSVKNSPALELIKLLKNNKIKLYDPQAKLDENVKNCIQVKSMNFLINNSNIIILMTPWPEFIKIAGFLNKIKKKIIVIDPYRMIDFRKINKKNIKYFTIGK